MLLITRDGSITGVIKALREKAALDENVKKALVEKDSQIAYLKKELEKRRANFVSAAKEKFDVVEGNKKLSNELKQKEAENMNLAKEKNHRGGPSSLEASL